MSHEANASPTAADADSHVLTRVANRIGYIELERPQALNALTTAMVRTMHAALDRWRDDPGVLAVIVRTRHARAFCAGGDVRFLYESYRAGDQTPLDTFFADEYRLNHAIFTFPKPYIAMLNGVVMGGGMGISQGARRTGGLRLVGPTTRMAMPETRIGLFPDVGMGWFLARTPGAIGRYLAVTGETLDQASAVYAGLADASLDESAWPALLDALESEPFASGAEVVARMRQAALPAPELKRLAEGSSLATVRGWIDRHFSRADVPAMLASLEAARHAGAGDQAQWAGQMVDVLRERSPLSMAVSLEVVSRAEGTMADCLRRDLDLTRSSFAIGDVMEGIRARIIDKDNHPHWRFANIEDVRREDVERMFESPWRSMEHPLRELTG
ncbi:enoyl-CoA hydratase/isomerase family protein [Paraburkholderia sp. CNPSo 3272]|uniref:enoyl-CoA hydratase/isomerase family protein n=1 Tax=Paraburkholderia sp. CNPSo 3272 TaxID=2940931 RepID=UPI0020B8D2E4|nr:enoyl-CoA hydratase/isomerase family protein [Paraburkholderia sp. CNPSo 3272]MCP3721779.1 enoyl-CoA hydratase/isomerase family protein [Paraburkholderia sp. CNPSo 3272]